MLPVVLILVVVVVALVVVTLLARRGAANARQRIEAAVAELEVVKLDKANFYGLASKGTGQVRGLGTLVLTPDELVFFQMVPAGELRIARSSVKFSEIARSFLGKTEARDLLLVTFDTAGAGEGDEPEEDRAAWDVPDADSWRVLLWPG